MATAAGKIPERAAADSRAAPDTNTTASAALPAPWCAMTDLSSGEETIGIYSVPQTHLMRADRVDLITTGWYEQSRGATQ
jgi:hypothetical protein